MTTVPLPPNSADNTVTSRFATVSNYATTAYNDAVDVLDELLSSNYSSGFNVINAIDVPTVEFSLGAAIPDKPDTTISYSTAKPSLVLNPVNIATGVVIPDFTAVEPVVNTVTPPTIVDPADPGAGPVLAAVTLPTEPSLIDPTLEVTPDIVLPTPPPDPPIRSLEDDLIDIDLIDLGANFTYNEAIYESDLGDAMYAWLLDQISDQSSTGLGPTVEDALWQRGRDRNQIINERTYNEAENYFASRGYVMPPGALMGRLTEALTEQTRSDEQLNYEIMIEMARLAQTNTHFVINSSLQEEKQLMDHFNQVAERAFKVATYVAQLAIETAKANVAIYNIRLENRKIAVALFSARVQADLVQFEVYKTKMEGAKLETDVKLALVEVYKSRIEAEKLKVQIYSIQMESAKLISDLQKNEIERYKALVDAYVAKVNANTAKYNQYAAEVAAEMSKVDIFKAQSQAYEARVRGVSVAAEVEIKNIMAQIEYNNGLIDEFKARMDGYIADAETSFKEAETKARVYGSEVDAYKGLVAAEASVADIGVKNAGLQIEARLGEINSAIQEAQVNLENGRINYQFDMAKLETVAKIQSQIAASALTSVNASASIGFQTGATAQGDMTKDEWSFSESHNYSNS